MALVQSLNPGGLQFSAPQGLGAFAAPGGGFSQLPLQQGLLPADMQFSLAGGAGGQQQFSQLAGHQAPGAVGFDLSSGHPAFANFKPDLSGDAGALRQAAGSRGVGLLDNAMHLRAGQTRSTDSRSSSAYASRHQAAEQRRRTRINERYGDGWAGLVLL